jgi:hypothetical protein
MRGDGGNHHDKLELVTTSCASQFTIPDTAGTSPNPVCNYTDTRSSKFNNPSCTLDFSYLLVSSTSFSSSSLISLSLVHNSIIIAEYQVKPSLSISPCHNHELTPSTAHTAQSINRVQHTLRVKHTPSTKDCLSSIQVYDCKLTHECSFRFLHASVHY